MPNDTPSLDEMIAAVRYALSDAITDADNFPDSSADQMRVAALRAALQRLEASRWRPRSVAPDTDDPILGYSPVAGDPAEDEQAGHYAITEGSFLRSGGWELCTLWQPIAPPSTTSEGDER